MEEAEKDKPKRRVWLWVGVIVGILVVVAGVFITVGAIKRQPPKPTEKSPAARTEKSSSDIGEKGQTAAIDGNSFVDTHTHVITSSYPLTTVIDDMKNHKISNMIIMQPPADLFRYQPAEELGIPEAFEKYPNQFAMMYQGEAMKLLQEVVNRGKFTPDEEAQFKSLAEEAAKSGKYVGFGEIALRHYPQPGLKGEAKKARDITIAGDHQFLLDLSDIAAKYNMVLDVHIEPDNKTLPGFEKLIAHNSQTKIVFDHAGWYNTGEGTAALFSNLLGKYSNLYASIKIRKPVGPDQLKVAIVRPDGSIGADWLVVFQKYPNRFVIGSDVKFGLDGDEGDAETQYAMTQKFIDQLPAEIKTKIMSENASTIFKLQ